MSIDAVLGRAIEVDVVGKTVLDLGGYHGDHALACLARGAAAATVVDSGEWRQYGWDSPRQHPGVRYVEADLMDWEEPADLVICSNVLYHLEDPVGGLRAMRALTREVLVLCTPIVDGSDHAWRLFDQTDPGEHVPVGADRYTVYFKPTDAGLRRALGRVGFAAIEDVGRVGDHVVLRCR